MRFQDDLGPQSPRTLHGRVKFVDLEPEQDPVSDRGGIRVDQVWVILFVPGVKLKNQVTGQRYPVVEVTMDMFGKRVSPSSSAYQRLLARTFRTAMSG